MPRTTNRRELLTDAGIEILARDGVRGLTHRAVDDTAAVPRGTTSNFFRSSTALLEAVARRLLDHQAEVVRNLADQAMPSSRADLVEALAALVEITDSTTRQHFLARLELTLAASRDPHLRRILREMRAVSLERLIGVVRSASGQAVPTHVCDGLVSMLTGIAANRITLGVPEADVRALIAMTLDGLLGPERRPATRHHTPQRGRQASEGVV